VSAVTAPGLTRSTCVPGLCVDPNGGNNSALIVINGVRAKITPTPSPKPRPKPATAAPAATTPATTPAATPTPALTFVAEPDPTGETPSTVEAVPAAHGSPLGLLAGVGGGIVVLAVVGALAVLRLRRPSP